MATFEQNLAKIRGQAVYGPEMREAIAEAIEQADDAASQTIDEKINTLNGRIDAMQVIVDDELFYMTVSRIGSSDDYQLAISEGE